MSAAQPDDHVPEETPGPSAPSPADWLVGPEEGLAAEMERSESRSAAIQRPTLLRPVAPETPTPAPLASCPPSPPPAATPPPVAPRPLASAPPAPVPAPPLPLAPAVPPPPARRAPGAVSAQPEDDDGFVRGPGGMTWEPGARSVPSLRRDTAGPFAPVPEPTHDFPMDDAEERAHASAAAMAAMAASATEAARPHTVVTPEVFEVATVAMPWWMQVAHTVRTDRRVQILLGVMVVVLVTIALWPRGEQPVSIASLRKHADRFDGVEVRVAGRVGQVFRVGGGYAYYLQDGRDTLVVFTRGREPHERQRVNVHGTMSTGYLDGQATVALFESTEAK